MVGIGSSFGFQYFQVVGVRSPPFGVSVLFLAFWDCALIFSVFGDRGVPWTGLWSHVCYKWGLKVGRSWAGKKCVLFFDNFCVSRPVAWTIPSQRLTDEEFPVRGWRMRRFQWISLHCSSIIFALVDQWLGRSRLRSWRMRRFQWISETSLAFRMYSFYSSYFLWFKIYISPDSSQEWPQFLQT